jgi:hypothetical protein
MDKIFIRRFAHWQPPQDAPSQSPALEFAEPSFRRRLSQVSKMAVQVVHDILPAGEQTKMLFVSLRGELKKQFAINKSLIEEGALSPAAFSHSVFNAPPALASICFALKGGYTALYPVHFGSALDAARAMIEAEAEKTENPKLIFVYADEYRPDEYADLYPLEPEIPPLAFALLLEKNPSEELFALPAVKQTETPASFFASLFSQSSRGNGVFGGTAA